MLILQKNLYKIIRTSIFRTCSIEKSYHHGSHGTLQGNRKVLPGRVQSNFIRFNRRLFATTETELKAIAAPAIIGFRRNPKKG
jgi:hypothetical protein